MRGHSLVELTEHDNSAADIIVHSMHIYIRQIRRRRRAAQSSTSPCVLGIGSGVGVARKVTGPVPLGVGR